MKLPQLKLGIRLLLYFITILLTIGIVLDLVLAWADIPALIKYAVYLLAGLCLAVSCCYLITDIKYIIQEKIKPFIYNYEISRHLADDYHFRSIIFSYPSLGICTIFAILNAGIAFYSRSYWHLTLAVYYFMLSLMRVRVILADKYGDDRKQKTKAEQRAWKAYKNCGILLILMDIALAGMVAMMQISTRGKTYPGFFIYAVAAYTFYKITRAIVHIVKANRTKSPTLMALRSIGYADALVSLLSLQIALFASFSSGNEALQNIMNLCTGIGICLLTLGIGIGMLITSRQKTNK